MLEQATIYDITKLRVRYSPKIPSEIAELIFEFFIVFSRFEFTLKKVGHLSTGSRDRVSPNWDTFCNKYQAKFNKDKTPLLTEAVNYYLSKPTKIQAHREGKFEWLDNTKSLNESEFAWLIRSIKYTRNNLFHGGKFPISPVRDKKLLYYGLVILYACLELDEELFRVFNAPS
jgi:hypothetical protein